MENNAVFCRNGKHESKGLFCEACNPNAIFQALKDTPKEELSQDDTRLLKATKRELRR